MANPNIVNINSIQGFTSSVTPAGTSAVVLLQNASLSANVYKIGLITISNLTSTAQTATVSLYTNGSVAANSAPSGGVAYPIAYNVVVPANASLVVVDKTSPMYVTEANSIIVTSVSSASNLCFTTSYEQIY